VGCGRVGDGDVALWDRRMVCGGDPSDCQPTCEVAQWTGETSPQSVAGRSQSCEMPFPPNQLLS